MDMSSSSELHAHHAAAQALQWADELQALLEAEFELLKTRSLEGLDELQQRKSDLLARMADIALAHGALSLPAAKHGPWGLFLERAAECRDLHRRNETLVSRQLESVRGALHTIQFPDLSSAVETYDRTGRLTHRAGVRGYSRP